MYSITETSCIKNTGYTKKNSSVPKILEETTL